MDKILFYNKFIKFLYMFRAPSVHYQEVKIVLYSMVSSHWNKCVLKLLKNNSINMISYVNIDRY